MGRIGVTTESAAHCVIIGIFAASTSSRMAAQVELKTGPMIPTTLLATNFLTMVGPMLGFACIVLDFEVDLRAVDAARVVDLLDEQIGGLLVEAAERVVRAGERGNHAELDRAAAGRRAAARRGGCGRDRARQWGGAGRATRGRAGCAAAAVGAVVATAAGEAAPAAVVAAVVGLAVVAVAALPPHPARMKPQSRVSVSGMNHRRISCTLQYNGRRIVLTEFLLPSSVSETSGRASKQPRNRIGRQYTGWGRECLSEEHAAHSMQQNL